MNEDNMDDRELPDPSDMDQDDYIVMSRCPNCKKMIDEESEVCPRCGFFITTEEEAPKQFSVWMLVGIVLMMVAMVMFFLER